MIRPPPDAPCLYKWLGAGGIGPQSNYPWSLPVDGTAGDWLTVTGDLIPCERGIHACRPDPSMLEWINDELYEMEYRGKVTEADDKVVVRQARLVRRLHWDERIARHFACDCADRTLALIARPDPRSVAAIAVARRHADGQATDHELAAARVDAWAAARVDAWAAARVDARAAAWAASRSAAWAAGAAACAAAKDGAWDAERQWQVDRLLAYAYGEVSP